MLILLPPSEGKTAPRRGSPLGLGSLAFPELTEARQQVLDELVSLCRGDRAKAADVLGLGATQTDEVQRNARLLSAPAARADRVYSGVLYDALDVGSLDGTARRRATRWLAVQSALFGLLRPSDRIPAYRLSGDVALPGLGRVSAHWRQVLGPVLREAVGSGLLVDLRSSTYAGFWRPAADLADRTVTVRVLQQVGDQRKVVSHFNKATKGRLVRELLQAGSTPGSPAEFSEHLGATGWQVEAQPPSRTGHRLDVVVGTL